MNRSICEDLCSCLSEGIYGPLGGKLGPHCWYSEDELEPFPMKSSSDALVQAVHNLLCQAFEVVRNRCEGVLELSRAFTQRGFLI